MRPPRGESPTESVTFYLSLCAHPSFSPSSRGPQLTTCVILACLSIRSFTPYRPRADQRLWRQRRAFAISARGGVRSRRGIVRDEDLTDPIPVTPVLTGVACSASLPSSGRSANPCRERCLIRRACHAVGAIRPKPYTPAVDPGRFTLGSVHRYPRNSNPQHVLRAGRNG